MRNWEVSYLVMDMPGLLEALKLEVSTEYRLNSRRLTWIVTTLRLRAGLPISRRSTRHDVSRKGPALLLERKMQKCKAL